MHRRVWEGQRVVVTKGPFKGYHGLVRAEDGDGVDVDLDARLAATGQTRQRLLTEQVVRLSVEYVLCGLSQHFDELYWQAYRNASDINSITKSTKSYSPSRRLDASPYSRTGRTRLRTRAERTLEL